MRRPPHPPSTSLPRSSGRPRRALVARFSPPQLIALVYLVGIVLGTGLLHLPGVTVPGAALNSIDRLFTATSAPAGTASTRSTARR